METKKTFSETTRKDIMLENSEYFKYIFKKTEKIAAAVFYTLRSDKSISHNDDIVRDLERATTALVDVSLRALASTKVHLTDAVTDLRLALVALESKLRLAHAARFFGPELLAVFVHEIDSVQRTLKIFDVGATAHPFDMPEPRLSGVHERRIHPTQTVPTITAAAPTSEGAVLPRRDRVVAVLRDKGQATIKDIMEVVSDVSEKTVQRELISLIKDNLVVREGERRWSKYKLAQ